MSGATKQRDDGGPAFSCATAVFCQRGMNVRDYFAAKAMQGLLTSTIYNESDESCVVFQGHDGPQFNDPTGNETRKNTRS